MTYKVIKNEGDYQRALARIDELMDAEPNTPEGDKLELLVILVELYEENKYPRDMPGSVDAIKFRPEEISDVVIHSTLESGEDILIKDQWKREYHFKVATFELLPPDLLNKLDKLGTR